MTAPAPARKSTGLNPAIPYIAPFLTFVGVMAVEKSLGLPGDWLYPIRFFVTLAVILVFSRHLVTFRPTRPLLSLGVGVAVFLIWVGPDLLFSYRHHWLFENSLMGRAASSLPPDARMSWPFILFRVLGTAFLVPVLEELFWRGWLMRWLIDKDFEKVPLGTYSAMSFWLVAILFASEHGPYWEVGLIAGVLYNWLMVRTRNLGDCVLSHALTNGILAAYVLLRDQWQYWL